MPAQTQQNQESYSAPLILEKQGKATLTLVSLAKIYKNLDSPIAKRKGVHSYTLHPFHNYMTHSNLSPAYKASVTSSIRFKFPTQFMMLCMLEQKAATLEEIRALEKNWTWILTTCPSRKRTIWCKWIFLVKHKTDGSVEWFKARLVPKHFTESHEVDYQEICSRYQTKHYLCSLVHCNETWLAVISTWHEKCISQTKILQNNYTWIYLWVLRTLQRTKYVDFESLYIASNNYPRPSLTD